MQQQLHTREQGTATDLGEPLLRVEDLYEERDLIVDYLESVSWLGQQLLYRLRGGERRGGAGSRRGASGSGAGCPGAGVVQMGTAEEDRIAARRDAAAERPERQAVEGRAGSGRGGTKKRLSRRQREAAHSALVLLLLVVRLLRPRW